MRLRIAARNVTIALFSGLAIGAPMAAHSDIIAMQMTDIPGDTRFATNNGLPLDSIRVLTVGNSVENSSTTTGGGSGVGRPIFKGMSIVKKFGESSAPLFLQVVRGRHIPVATISFYRIRQGAPVRYYTITLREVFIASHSWVGNSNGVDAADAENLELTYSRIELLDNESGSRACYDLETTLTC